MTESKKVGERQKCAWQAIMSERKMVNADENGVSSSSSERKVWAIENYLGLMKRATVHGPQDDRPTGRGCCGDGLIVTVSSKNFERRAIYKLSRTLFLTPISSSCLAWNFARNPGITEDHGPITFTYYCPDCRYRAVAFVDGALERAVLSYAYSAASPSC
ncbi:hypothetical protein KC19_5G079700 [Ceratodon purpureus]|uniref:Uncharacterized protein n=1 Tax=Ceratodon purpureus TaxID=3225 RepID=A0A8T0I086_CERPU|nr:hypothetical protein KC19_5G079700 [Ceratodon purpureus]